MSPTEIDASDVLRSYSSLLATPSTTVRSDRELSYPKRVIKDVLRHCLSMTSDEVTRNTLEAAYLSLAVFQPLSDDEVQAIGLYEGAGNAGALLDRDLTALASSIAETGDSYPNLQRHVLNEQRSLMKELEKLRDT
jgi:hypothetical protein